MSLLGCGAAGAPSERPDPASGEAAGPAPPSARLRDQDPRIQLIDAGAAPLRELGMRYGAGARESCTMTIAMSLEQRLGQQPLPGMPLPGQRASLALAVAEVDDDGAARIRWSVQDMAVLPDETLPAQLREAIDRALAGMKGLGGSYRLTELGHSTDSTLDPLPEAVEATMGAQLADFHRNMEQMTVPLPAHPVGVGARWRVEDSVQIAGTTLSRRAEYVLTGVDDEAAELTTETTFTGGAQDIALPNGAGTARVESVDGKGTAKTRLSWDRLCPTAEVDSAVAMVMTIDADGSRAELSQNIATTIAISGAP